MKSKFKKAAMLGVTGLVALLFIVILLVPNSLQNIRTADHKFIARLINLKATAFYEVQKAKTNKKVVALTFDDGPDPRFTPSILNILKKYNVKATFFIIGERAKKYPDIIYRELSQGEEIENHTYTHPEMLNISYKQTIKEYEKNQKFLYDKFKIKAMYFRAPRGDCDGYAVMNLLKRGIKTVMWTESFEKAAMKSPLDRAQKVVNAIGPGYIILEHDGRLNRKKTVIGLPYIIEGLKKKGYTFVTLKELFSLR